MKLSRVNTLLLILIIIVNSYTILLPLAPGALFWFQKQGTKQKVLEQAIRVSSSAENPVVAKENRLVIPSMILNEPVFEGKDASTLNQGLWHRPLSSTPGQGSNIVFAGHRLTYKNPKGTLYHLDKVRPGDTIGLTWNQKQYVYIVAGVKTVAATQTEIEAPTDTEQLTIYTCTPLWLPKNRLVVIAHLQRGQE